MDTKTNKVDFGHEQVSPEEKTQRVHEVFSRVANRYDAMNDIMSFGTHRLLKRVAMEYTALRKGQSALDVAGGTGDLALQLNQVTGTAGRVVLLDINESMVHVGRDRLIDKGNSDIEFVVADAEAIPFPADSFHAITLCFGLRNMTDKERALGELHRVLKPGGRIVILEFAKPRHSWLKNSFSLYQRLWPVFGQFVVGDSQPYKYLVESIEKHPSQSALKQMIVDTGFNNVDYDNLLGGIVAIHIGEK
ncbi:MAG: bifunctional demethylmenaquinone methyltransferase/2-methoxy-6-polyprenyl-1,4-benzoquinol methylase UbiE [Gammaproteobacteria bacterium]|nr:bifunctional demethylmenaquinone methyltransferase/2-methoxy-6-polyprenyl-1,4-benzoquinol methylase UbiE [Gammaproteobacteria bacterium]